MTENFSEGNVDTGKQTGTTQVDNFSKELSDFLLDEKLNNKEQISNFLISNSDLKNGFEYFLKTANLRQKIKCKKELQNCSTEEEIKSIILENIPEGYKVGGDELGDNMEKIENIENKDFINDKEQADKKTEQADKKTEQADKKTEQADKNKGQATLDEKNSKQIIEEAKEYKDYLVNKYPELNKKVDENIQTVKQQLENNGILNQLRQSHNEQFINDYVLVQATLVELKSNPTSYEQSDISYFEKLVKNLDNACNIPDTNLSSFSSENISQTRAELFNEDVGNNSLIGAKNQNMESHDYSKIFPEMGDKDLIENYGNFLEGGLKEFCQRYQNNPELQTRIENTKGNPTTEEEKILLKNYQTMISELKRIKEETENGTKNLMEELTILSQIKGMSMCIGQENGKDFNLNKAREIQNDNGVLTLNGHIDGVDFSVRHDTNKENARLQTKSKLGISDDKNSFMVGLKGQYVDSPFIMPSQEEIFSVIIDEFQSDSNDIKKSDDINNYFEKLQQNVMGRMDKVYSEAKYAQHYIRNKVKGEKVVDDSLGFLRKIKSSIDTDLAKPINQSNSGRLYDFVKMLKFNIENSTDTEKDRLCKCISKIMEISDNYRNNNGVVGFDTVNYPPIIENYLKNQTWLENGNENSKLGLIFDMLGYYNLNSKDTRSNSEGTDGSPSKVFINNLYRDLFEFSGGESPVSVKRTNEDKEKHDREEANNVLDLNNNDLWPPVNNYGGSH